jgi:hypothetical protein
VVDGIQPGILNDGSCLFVRLGQALARGDRGGLNALGLIKIENIRPPEERNASGPAVLVQQDLPGFVPLFEDLVIDDRRGFLALLDMAAEVEALLESKPER